MSIRAMHAVWEHSQHEDTKLNLMLALADSANDDGDCWPSVLGLSLKIRRKPRQTRNLLRALEESGEISTRIEAGPEGKNIYHINLPGAALEVPKGKARTTAKLPPGNQDCRPPAIASAAKSSVIVVPSLSNSEQDMEKTTTDGLAATASAAPRQQLVPPPPTADAPDDSDPDPVAGLLAEWEDCGVAGEYLRPIAERILDRPAWRDEVDDLLDYWQGWNERVPQKPLGPRWLASELRRLSTLSQNTERQHRWCDYLPPAPASPEYWQPYAGPVEPPEPEPEPLSPAAVLWQQALDELALTLPAPTVDMALRPARPVALDGDILTLQVRDGWQTWLSRLDRDIRRALERVAGRPIDFAVKVATQPQEERAA